jgi:tetratricopeptide (TPR) repeat protein
MSDRYRVDRSVGGGYTVRKTDLVEDVAMGAAGVAGTLIGASINGIGSLARQSRDRRLAEAVDQMISMAQREDFDSLLKSATAFSQKYRQEPVGQALLCVALTGKGQYNDALAAMDRALQLGLPPSEAIDLRLDIYFQSGDTARLLKEFSNLTQNSQRSQEGYLGRAKILTDLGDFDQALADVSQAIALSPDAFGYCMRGDIYRGQGQLEKAIDDYTRAIRLEQNEPRLLDRRAEVYEQLGKTAEAQADREAIQRIADIQTKVPLSEAIDLLVYLREAGIRLKPTPSGDLEVVGGRIKKETSARIDSLKAELLDILRPDNDRAAAFLLIAWLRAGKVVLEVTPSGDVRIARGRLSGESQAELARLKPHVVKILQE